MTTILSIRDLRKSYADGFEALKGVSLDIEEGEILALLGPNGAGKTTLISTVCGITTPTSGSVTVGGHDIQTEYRAARKMIGLVPQEIALEPFEKVWNTVRFSRGLFGHSGDNARIEEILRKLSLWDKRRNAIKELSGGMKRRVLIAKALAHEPRVLFLDEPTAGVDVELRKDMWEIVAELKQAGVKSNRLKNAHVAFFKSINPGHTQGDELVCLTEIDPDNLTRAGRRMVDANR